MLYCLPPIVHFQLVFSSFNIITLYVQYLLNRPQTIQLLQALIIKIYTTEYEIP